MRDVTIPLNALTAFIAFLLTHPVWDVTSYDFVLLCFIVISTHTSRVGCDNKLFLYLYMVYIFLLTHPVWDVTRLNCIDLKHLIISTHTSRVGCDIGISSASGNFIISTHTSRVGCDIFKPPLVIVIV